MSSADLDTAEELMNRYELPPAFELLSRVVADPKCELHDKAEAYNLMGVIVIMDPSFGEVDESGSIDSCGLPYFKRALKLCPDLLSALLNTVGGFGELPSDHQDVVFTEHAIRKLMQLRSELTQEHLDFLERQSEAVKRFLEKQSGQS